MNRRLYIIGVLLLCVILGGCYSKWPENGDLDGQWKLTGVQDLATEETSVHNVVEEQVYYSVQLKLFSLRKIGGEELLAYFNHTGDSLIVYEIYHQTGWREDEELIKAGDADFVYIKGIEGHFKVEFLNKKNMILVSKDYRLYFDKF